MGAGDRYQQPRFTNPAGPPGYTGPWPFSETGRDKCSHVAVRRTFHAPSKTWLCDACRAAKNPED